MSSKSDEPTLNFVNDLNPLKDIWNMKARVIRKWRLPYKIELILIDEKGSKIQACIKNHLIPVFEKQLAEDDVVILCKCGVGENNDVYTVVKHDYKVNFYRSTTVTRVSWWQGVEYGFDLIPFNEVLKPDGEEAVSRLSVDVAGTAIWCGNLDIFGRPPKESKRIWFDLQDLDGMILRCTLWNDYAERYQEFISGHNSNEHVMVVIQHGKINKFKGNLTVQNDRYATRLFINEEIDEVNNLRRSLIHKHGADGGSSSQSVFSSQTVYPLHQEFVTDTPRKHLDEINDVGRPMFCVVVSTIKIVEESCGWFYAACQKCMKKVLTKLDYLETFENVSDEIVELSTNSLICLKCKCECSSITPKFKVQVRVQDETGSVSFVIFDRKVAKIVGSQAIDIRERQVKGDDTESFPYEICRLVDKKLAFKIEVSDYNLQKDYRIYTVNKICDDPIIIVEVVASVENPNENTDEVSQPVVENSDFKFSESSQGFGQISSKNALSVTADSSAIDAYKDSATSPNCKRKNVDVSDDDVFDLSSTTKRSRKKISKLNI